MTDGPDIPLQVYREKRSSVSMSLRAKGAILRVPLYFSKSDMNMHVERAGTWVKEQIHLNPKWKELTAPTPLQDGSILILAGITFQVNIKYLSNAGRNTAKRDAGQIFMTIDSSIIDNPVPMMDKLLGNLIAKFCMEYLERRVDFWNDRAFQTEISGINMRNNKSKWGSCSSNGNLSFSSRLLLAPVEVIDYVIVHELAHRKEMNHSNRFWSVVAQVMPEYKKHEIWLKKNSNCCHFDQRSQQLLT